MGNKVALEDIKNVPKVIQHNYQNLQQNWGSHLYNLDSLSVTKFERNISKIEGKIVR